ncbi:MAG: AAA family ATPase, partial [Deltaproteobacteria bacterium]|nr:AAA family ATPase [Deltaproteobacteria bacterium]
MVLTEISQTPPDSRELSLGIGESDFQQLIHDNFIYVDKTKSILSLLTRKSRRFFLTRPRRFGKSLLISTIEDILHGKEELFKNTYISKPEAKYDWKKYHVIRLDMSSFGNNCRRFDKNLTNEIRDIAEMHGVRLKEKESGPAIVKLIKKLFRSFNEIPLVIDDKISSVMPDMPKVAVLIDEYDFPLVTNFKNPKFLETIRDQLYQFYAQLKSVLSKIDFLFITGITKFSMLTSSSGMNAVKDISFGSQFATICGFTREEIEFHFTDFLISAHKDLIANNELSRLSKPADVLDMILEWYDGYTWDGETNVLNPESVLNFFDTNSFGRYWYDTGGPNFLEQLQYQNKAFFKMFAKNVSYKGTITRANIGKLTPLSSLLQAGYLTIRKPTAPDRSQLKDTYDLVIPNKEVRISYAEDYLIASLYPDLDHNSLNRENLIDRYKDFCNALGAIQPKEAQKQLSSIFAAFPHVHHPKKNIVDREFFYKSHMLPALYYADAIVTAEKREAGGAPDFVLEMRHGDVLVMEVKYSKLTDSADSENILTPSAHQDSVETIPTGDQDRVQESADTASGTDFHPGNRETSALLTTKKELKDKMIASLLDGGIRRAFKQILDYQYARKYLGGKNAVYAVAVSIVDRFHVKIEFKRLNPDSGRE